MFANVNAFWLFLLLPVLILLMIFDIYKFRKRAKLIAGEKINYIIPYYSEGQKWLRLFFYSLGFCLMILALARPQWGVETIDTKVKGRDVLVLLDVSYSMAASDVIPSRIESAKRGINELLEMENGDRIGLMVFSAESELLSPVTSDYAAISFFLDSVYPNMLGKEGTNIGGALIDATTAFDDNQPRNKMILLFTDGENLEGDYYLMLKKIKDSEIKIFTVGVGTKNGDLIPVRNEKGEIVSALKDEKGEHIKSKLDEKRLLEIAQTTGGSYIRTTGAKGEIKKFINSINSIERKDQGNLKYEQKKEQFDIFLIPALILFVLGFILDQGRLIRFAGNKFDWLFNKNLMIFFMMIFLLTGINVYSKVDVSSDAKLKDNKQLMGDPNGGFWGNNAFKKGNYNKALEKYLSATLSLKGNELGKLNYNLGNTYLKTNDLKKTGENYETSLVLLTDDKIKAMVYYNHGLAVFKNQDYKTAKELFKKAILLNPEDEDARYNYEVCKILEAKSKQQDQKQDTQNQKQTQQKKEEQKQLQKNQQDKKEQQLSKEEIDNLMKALDEKEKKENKENNKDNQDNNDHRGKYW